MPARAEQVHSLYVEIANLQMAKARQQKIKEALLSQIANCDSEIQHVDRVTAELRAKIDSIDPTLKPAKNPNSSESEPASSSAFKFKY